MSTALEQLKINYLQVSDDSRLSILVPFFFSFHVSCSPFLICDFSSFEFYLGAVPINSRSLAVVEPRIVEHQPDVVHILPWITVFAIQYVAANGAQIHWLLDDLEVVGYGQRLRIDWISKWHRLRLLPVQLLQRGHQGRAQLFRIEFYNG